MTKLLFVTPVKHMWKRAHQPCTTLPQASKMTRVCRVSSWGKAPSKAAGTLAEWPVVAETQGGSEHQRRPPASRVTRAAPSPKGFCQPDLPRSWASWSPPWYNHGGYHVGAHRHSLLPGYLLCQATISTMLIFWIWGHMGAWAGTMGPWAWAGAGTMGRDHEPKILPTGNHITNVAMLSYICLLGAQLFHD